LSLCWQKRIFVHGQSLVIEFQWKRFFTRRLSMRLKTHNVIGMLAWSLAVVAGSLPLDSRASELRVAATDRGVNRQLAVRAVSYSAPAYAAHARPALNEPDTLSVSVVPEVDRWTMLAALLGLISMRLWRSGKKNLLVIK
jgi:hypothetical protein